MLSTPPREDMHVQTHAQQNLVFLAALATGAGSAPVPQVSASPRT